MITQPNETAMEVLPGAVLLGDIRHSLSSTLSTHDNNSLKIQEHDNNKNKMTNVIVNSELEFNEIPDNNNNLQLSGNTIHIVSQDEKRVDSNIWPRHITKETSTINWTLSR